MATIRTFLLPDSSSPTTPAPAPLTLALARKSGSYLLVHPTPQSTSAPNERQNAIINALVASDPFPSPNPDNHRERIWLKIGAGKKGEEGGENEGLLEKLVEAGVVVDTGIKSTQGMISYPLVEVLVPPSEFCQACASCGTFENALDEPERFKRCARCKQAFYCSALCQGKDWKAGHKPVCLDLPQDDDASIEEARRKALLRLYGRTVTPHSGARSKMD